MVLFEIVEAWRSTGAYGRVEWTLCFGPPHDADAQASVHSVHILGVPPTDLLSVCVRDSEAEAFSFGTKLDPVGRQTSAGEFMKALFGTDAQGGLRVHSTEFQHLLACGGARVEIRVCQGELEAMADVAVFIDVD